MRMTIIRVYIPGRPETPTQGLLPVPLTFKTSDVGPWPTSTTELDASEQLIVWAFRRWALGLRRNDSTHWSLVWNEFARQFGVADGKEAMSAFAGLVRGLLAHARRTMRHHEPCCASLGADEVALVAFVSACQHRDPHRARRLAEWLARRDGAGELLEAGIRLGRVMRRRGRMLPVRTNGRTLCAATDRPANPDVTVH